MKRILSTSGASMARTSPLQEVIDVIAEAGFDAVDFWLYRYCDGDDAPMMGPNWRKWVQDARRHLEARGLFAWQTHCTYHHSGMIEPDFSFAMPGEIFQRNIEACRLLDCPRLILHPVFYRGRVTDEATRERLLEINARWFRALLPCAERFGVELHLENTFDFADVQQPGDPGYMCTSAREMLRLVEMLDHPLVKLCLDTGHARIAGQDLPAMIRAYGDHLGSLHLNDNFGRITGEAYEDLHLFPGYGSIHWDAVFDALREVGFAGALNLEPVGALPHLPHDVRVIELRAAREIVVHWASVHGMMPLP